MKREPYARQEECRVVEVPPKLAQRSVGFVEVYAKSRGRFEDSQALVLAELVRLDHPQLAQFGHVVQCPVGHPTPYRVARVAQV